ncbi:hypothetical protein BDV95DRAFT_190076 [Massariosphaeria phaeospora]|uniref:Uncharacterized protein n=1 Tax=Massariosphaeria phaeospora TaxID=100035 RepID=A0A7C8M1A3_9PLEO|nr:hypothetical protein BDV95DRAFT_190076 [Massariosphaeria phaeospora]
MRRLNPIFCQHKLFTSHLTAYFFIVNILLEVLRNAATIMRLFIIALGLVAVASAIVIPPSTECPAIIHDDSIQQCLECVGPRCLEVNCHDPETGILARANVPVRPAEEFEAMDDSLTATESMCPRFCDGIRCWPSKALCQSTPQLCGPDEDSLSTAIGMSRVRRCKRFPYFCYVGQPFTKREDISPTTGRGWPGKGKCTQSPWMCVVEFPIWKIVDRKNDHSPAESQTCWYYCEADRCWVVQCKANSA